LNQNGIENQQNNTGKITMRKLIFNIFNLKPFADASPEVILMQTD